MSPKPSPKGLVLGFAGPTSSPSSAIECTPKPPPTPYPALPYKLLRHPPLPFPAAQPGSSPGGSISGFWPKVAAPARFPERVSQPPLSHRPQYPNTPLYRAPLPFAVAHPKSTPSGSVSVFWPKTAAPARFAERVSQPPLSRGPQHPSTPLYCAPLPFAVAHLKPSPGGSILGFRPKSHLPACVTQRSTTTPLLPRTRHSTTSTHLPKPQFATAHPKLSPGGSISGFRHKYHLPACVTQRSTTTPPPPRTHHPTTSPYRSRQPFLATYP